MGRLTQRRKVTVVRRDDEAGLRVTRRPDTVIVEEPMELRVGGAPLSVTMRTPGRDIDLIHGFLFTEGIIGSMADVSTARYCAGSVTDDETGTPQNTYNVLDVTLAAGVPLPQVEASRNFYTTSSCGVCGKASIESISQQVRWPVADDDTTFEADVLLDLPDKLRAQQSAFDRTGGLHAAGLFTANGETLQVAEDVGRHNAVDKVIGWALRNGRLPGRGCVLVVSSRASFELTQKALMAGIPALVAVSAPSSLAIECAEDAGMTLAGFVRGGRMNVYTGDRRIVGATSRE